MIKMTVKFRTARIRWDMRCLSWPILICENNGVNSNICWWFESHLHLKISAFWTLFENGRSRCKAVPEILIIEVSGCGTIAGDRG
jgi:hypothetical protein